MTEKEATKIYKELRKKYTDEEIAESFIFSVDMSDKEKTELSKQIIKHKEKTILSKEDIEFINKLKNE